MPWQFIQTKFHFDFGLSLLAVLRQVIADPAGDTTVITVSGNAEFKETITVNKKTKTAQEGINHYSFEVCIPMTEKMGSGGFMSLNIWTEFFCYDYVLSGWW
jgi:predicted phosphoadenosine phosphosulfate sulfurtransferase